MRATLAAARRARPSEAIATARSAIAGHVLARASQLGWRTVAGYEPLPTEPGSDALLTGLRARGIRVIVPVPLPDRDLAWRAWPIRESEPSLGVAAIADVDAVLVPALAVAADGTRLGRGGGSYDRALARVSGGTPVAALLYEDELVDVLPRDEWDVAVHAAVTPAGWRELARSS